MPKIQDMQAWQQAEQLFQPIFIRLIDNFRKSVEDCGWNSTFEDISEPHQGYIVHLKKGDIQTSYDLWQLCYQICFVNYDPALDVDGTQAVSIDTTLLEADTNEVDWEQLETKTQATLAELFTQLGAV